MAPPFGDYKKLSSPEYIKKINSSSVKILFIGLGCPKQEIWMSKNKKKLGCTLIGVGAAIDFISKNKKNPPRIIQSIGAEWLFRLVCEPQRLLVRNFKHNPRFLILFLKQMLNKKFKK